MTGPDEATARAVSALRDISIESWRLAKLLERLASDVDAGEQQRYRTKLRWFHGQLAKALEAAGLTLVNLEGQAYDAGHAVNALNLGDFEPDERLVVDQMVEPILMGESGVLREGTVILRKRN